jgi:hypothetical protein
VSDEPDPDVSIEPPLESGVLEVVVGTGAEVPSTVSESAGVPELEPPTTVVVDEVEVIVPPVCELSAVELTVVLESVVVFVGDDCAVDPEDEDEIAPADGVLPVDEVLALVPLSGATVVSVELVPPPVPFVGAGSPPAGC